MHQTSTAATVLDKLLEPLARCFTVEVARQVADVRADSTTQARLDELADKAADGQLTADERDEYEAYVEALDVIGLIQAKARTVLTYSAS